MQNFSFQNIPQRDEICKNKIEADILKNSYSKFIFKYFQFTKFYEIQSISDKNTITNQFQHFLINYLSGFKLIIYHKTSPTHKNKLDLKINQIFDIVICIENQCIIIEDIDLKLFDQIIHQLKEKQNIIINVTNDDENEEENNTKQIKEEIYNFCQKNKFEIKNNQFLCKTIQSVIGFLIRRYYYPTNYFKDKSFFDFDQSKVSEERSVHSEFICLINSKSLLEKNLIQMKDRIKRDQEKISFKIFDPKEFIIVRTIHSNQICIYYLVIHIETLYLFVMKKIIHPNEFTKENEHEKSFDENYSHRCLCHFYGFIKKNEQILGYIYEFMCNGSLKAYFNSNRSKVDDTFLMMTIDRLYQGIEYLHSHSLLHRDLNPTNVLIDHDFIPYISDFETIRYINDDEWNAQRNFTKNIGSFIYVSPEQYKGNKISYSTDIFSFGLVIFFIYENDDKMKMFISKEDEYKIQFHSKIPINIQNMIINCIKINPEQRLEHQKIKSILIDETRSLIHQEILSFKEKIQIGEIIYESFFLENENTSRFFKFISTIFILKEEKNEQDALIKLGDIYYCGQEIEKDYFKAKKYYELSSKLKNSIALLKLGNLYENGLGVQQDYLKAKELYELSAEQNNLIALLKLGNLYENGLGVQQDYSKAKELYELSAEQNNSNAFILLGNLYYFGSGVKRDFLKAKEYYELSKKLNNSYAFNHLGYLYLKCPGIVKDFLKAIYYFEQSARLNNSYALYNLGIVYLKGLGVEKDYSIAKDYFKESANFNNSDALIKIGNIYLRGLGVEKDYLEAKRYYELSAYHNNPDALFKIGNLYLQRHGDKIDYLKAIQYFELASQNKNLDSLFFLADLYSSGELYDVDISKAIQYFLESIRVQHEKIRIVNNIDNFPYYKWIINHYYYRSYNDLGLIYFTVYNNIEKANQYIRIAAYNEYPFGQNNFGLLNEFYFNQIEIAEYMYNKSSSKSHFALASFNLGRLKEKDGKKIESIELYKKASIEEDIPLTFHNHQHYDKRLEISKTFIVCLTNLKLSEFYFSKSNFKEAKKYFIKSFSKLNEKQIKFKIMKNNIHSIFEHLKYFILNYPPFNLINQSFLNNEIKNQIFSNEGEHLNKTIIKPLNNKYYSENNISIDLKKTNDFFESNESENKKFNQFSYTPKIIEEVDEIIFEKPSEIFDFFIRNPNFKETFIIEIKKIIGLMNLLVYTPPYHILFGRISIETPKQKQNTTINPNAEIINQSFYDGFYLY